MFKVYLFISSQVKDSFKLQMKTLTIHLCHDFEGETREWLVLNNQMLRRLHSIENNSPALLILAH